MKNYISLLFIAILLIQCNRQQNVQITIPKEVQEMTLRDSIHIALDKADVYFEAIDFESRGDNIIYMITDLLSIEFDRKLKIPTIEELIATNDVYKEGSWMMYGRYFADRNLYGAPEMKDTMMKILYNNRADMDIRTFWTMYCPYFPIHTEVLKIINADINSTEYDMTHAAIQIESIVRNGYCNLDSAEINDMKRRVVKRLNEDTKLYFKSFETSDKDLIIEIFAVLAYLQQYPLLNKDYIRKTLQVQNTDGGWRHNDKESDSHTSVLAYWFLLEADRNLEFFSEHFVN